MTSARDFTNRLADLLRRERAALAELLVALAAFDERRLRIELGHSSLFYFLHRELGLSHVPAHVRREAWVRDGGKCHWPLEGGGICGSTHQVELDHLTPRGRGGPSTIENTRILCKFHNDLAARQSYGNGWMDRFTRSKEGSGPRTECPAPSPP